MTAATLQDARSNLVRERVLDGVFEVLAAGEDLTFAKVAKAAGVPERTIYRHFPSKEALHAAIWSWANERMGFTGPFPTDEAGYVALVRTAHPGFERLAPVIRELLASKDGLAVRLTANDQRRQSARAAVSSSAPGLNRRRRTASRRRAATAHVGCHLADAARLLGHGRRGGRRDRRPRDRAPARRRPQPVPRTRPRRRNRRVHLITSNPEPRNPDTERLHHDLPPVHQRP